MRLREQLVIASVLLTGALTLASLLMLKKMVQVEINKQVASSVDASTAILRTFQQEREERLSRTAALLSELPTLKALMATQHRSTVEDGSEPFWRLSGGDMFLLATPDGKLLAKHFARQQWPDEPTEALLLRNLASSSSSSWWFYGGHLYWVFVHPLTAGARGESRDLGVVVLGYESGPRLTESFAIASRSEIALSIGDRIVASTLDASAVEHLQEELPKPSRSSANEFELGGKQYSEGVLTLQDSDPVVVCRVLLPLDTWRSFLTRLNTTLLVLGTAALALGGVLFSFIARAMTRPLENVVAGIRALVGGDYNYNVSASGSMEIEHLAASFATMRTALLESQQNKLAAERAAIMDRTASSISHDLRHYLSALVANAEFLSEGHLAQDDREEVYQEIKIATVQMLDLIDSLRELSRDQSALQLTVADLEDCIRKAMDAVLARRDLCNVEVVLDSTGELSGTFDPLKIERVFVNLILNSCEAVARQQGRVVITCRADGEEFTVRIADDGSGIPEPIRATLFDPFVSSGKPNGTGLGLAIVHKILHDHGGSIVVEETGDRGTVMLVRLPRKLSSLSLPVTEQVQGNL